MLRWLISHDDERAETTATADGVPSGIEFSTAAIAERLTRWPMALGGLLPDAGPVPTVRVTGGVRRDLTSGAPIAIAMSALEASADQSFAQGVVALGLLSEAFLRQSLGVEIVSHTAAGDVETGRPLGPGRTTGRVVEIVAYGLPPGLGSHVQADRRLEARLAAAFFGVAGVCRMEIGEGFEVATRRGSSAHDEIFGCVGDGGVTVYRRTNRAGGLEGGMTNGQPLVARLAITPAHPTTTSIDFDGLTDRDGVSPLGMVGQSLMSLVLMDAVLEKFGGTTLADTRTNARSFIRHLRIRTQAPSAGAPANRLAGHSSYTRPISE